jgi:hypothetical protein
VSATIGHCARTEASTSLEISRRNPNIFSTDDRIARATELLIYCMRLYTSLGAERNARVLISVTFGGLSGRSLGRQTPDRPETLERLTGACAHDSAQSEVVIELPNIMRSLHKLVDVLTTPLFANFDFYQLPAAERDRSINKSLLDWGSEIMWNRRRKLRKTADGNPSAELIRTRKS